MKTTFSTRVLVALMAVTSLVVAGCGGVSGNTYQTEGGGIQIAFHSGGKADFSMGPLGKQSCTYVEDAKTVTLTCQGDKIVFTIRDSDGALIPPRDSMLGAAGGALLKK